MASSKRRAQALPPISSFAFADILRTADSPDFQHAIDGIAEICAKSRMSLADEYASHLPPLGEITAATSATERPELMRARMRPALSSVPEASSGSSEGTRKSTTEPKKRRMFSFGRREEARIQPMRSMRIGSMGRTIPVTGTTASASSFQFPTPSDRQIHASTDLSRPRQGSTPFQRTSEAQYSLQQLLAHSERVEAT